jgi:hypothetical protein
MNWCFVGNIIDGSTDQLPVGWDIHYNTNCLLDSCVLLPAVKVGRLLAII